MKIGKVEKYLLERIKKEKLLFIVVDPIDYPKPEDAIKTGIEAAEGGASAVIVGGSIGVQGTVLDYVVKSIKEKVGPNPPIILFPGNIATITEHADAVYYMSLLNSRNPYWITQAQTLAAPVVKRVGIEPLSVAYLVVEPGGTVGWVGDANLIPRDRPKFAVALAMAAENMGFHFVLMDAGSASSQGPIPTETIKAVKESIDMPLIAAGGISNPDQAKQIAKAGADILHIGTMVERTKNVKETVKELAKKINEK